MSLGAADTSVRATSACYSLDMRILVMIFVFCLRAAGDDDSTENIARLLQSGETSYLKGDYDLILHRLQGRHGHFMPATLLKSQFDTLEQPTPDEHPRLRGRLQ